MTGFEIALLVFAVLHLMFWPILAGLLLGSLVWVVNGFKPADARFALTLAIGIQASWIAALLVAIEPSLAEPEQGGAQ